jgi:hypothetical protein
MTSDVIDILLITLSIETDEIDFAAILEFLELEFFDALEREDFVLALKINKNIYNISLALKAKKPWAISLTNLFFSSLGKQDRYQEMGWANEYERIASIPEKNQALLTILKQLSGDSLLILGRLATQIPSDNDSLRKIVSDIIASKAKDDPHSLCKLIKESDEEAVLKFLPIVEQMEKKYAASVYLQMASHSSREIRTEGIHGFFLANTKPKSDEIVQIMQEPEDTLRRIIVSYLEHLDGQLLESILKTFLSEKCAQVNDERYILHCYKLLGNCVSSDSLEFLQRNLLETEMKSMFSHNMKAHKTGSAYALKSLGTSDALMVLEKGAESMRPDVRNICKKLLSN